MGSRVDPEAFFEVLEGGKRLGEREFSGLAIAPGGPVRVGAEAYLPYYLDNIAARLANRGDIEDAAEVFEEAIALAPDAARVRYNYGTFLLQQQRSADALLHLDAAIEQGWDDADAWVNRGAALFELGRKEEARRCFEAALERDPGHIEAKSNLAKLNP